MKNTYYEKTENYINTSSERKEVNWFNLPKTMHLLMKDNKMKVIRKLISDFGENPELNEQIKGILISPRHGILKISFPIGLDQECYIRIYALMISEGSYITEFSLNVPEEEFHRIFAENLKKLISPKITIKLDKNHSFKRSRASSIIRNIIPIPNKLPKILFANKLFGKEYLKIAFEAEGCPIYNLKRSKKYIKLSRNSNATKFIKKEGLIPEKKIFINEIKRNFNKEYLKLIHNPDSLILGEHLLLKHLFNIDSMLQIESIRLNKLGNRKGKISVKWVLYIYSGEDIKKFYENIGFMSPKKQNKCKEMLKNIPSKRKQYFALSIMNKVQKKGVFIAKDFNKEMKKIGYTTPKKFIWDYCKNKKIIEKLGDGKYRLLIN